MRLFPILAALLLTVSCTSLTSDIRTDSRTYNQANLRAYHTYQWDSAALLLADATGTWKGSGLDVGRAFKEAVDVQMKAKGYTLLASGADVSVSMGAIGTREQLEAERAKGSNPADATIVTEGCLLVDVFQTGTNKLLWRGVARSTATTIHSREEAQERINFAVKEMFADFQR